MAWYYIILIILGYILMSAITGAIVIREIGEEEPAMLGILWPIALPMLLALIIGRWIYLKLFS
jgi:hypothetical protein